jgi:ketosteroid isomerase-like protein
MKRFAVSASLLLFTTSVSAQGVTSELAHEVFAAESSFAASLANRDIAAFRSHIAPDAIFFGRRAASRGREAVVHSWRPFFDGPSAPFSWRPETVEVLDSGMLALSSGPVFDPSGKRMSTFNSVWRREPSGAWRVVLDKGCPVCDCERNP